MKVQPQSHHFQPWKIFNKSRSQVGQLLFALFLLITSLEVIESRFMVKTLPGFPGDLPFTLETGYIGVGESDDVQLFYYFIESEGNPKDDPLILWLTGGPGCSALSGLLYEIGPIAINYESSTSENTILETNPYGWTKAASIIFLDQPAGSGFSYAKTPEAYISNDTSSTKQAYSFMRKWLVDHPKFLNNPFYVGGESYDGIVVPMIVQEIYNGNEVGEVPHINIIGYMLGNPLTDTSRDPNSRIPFAHRVALLSDAIYKSAKDNCHGEYVNVDPNNSLCIHDLQVIEKCLEKISIYHILQPYCESSNTLKSNRFRRTMRSLDNTSADISALPQNHIQGCREDTYTYSEIWANSIDVRAALNIREEFTNVEWVRCNETLKFDLDMTSVSYTHEVSSTVGYHRRLADKNCRALIYSGDHDMAIPYLGTLDWIESLNLSLNSDWRPWFIDEQVAGYTMTYLRNNYNLTFATVKGGGHTAPEYNPKESFHMFMRWIANDAL